MDQRATKTREALLEAAKSLFAERGFGSVATRELVDRAGANIASIAYHFGSKRGLYLEAVRDSMQQPEIARSWDLLAGPHADRNEAMRTIDAFVRGVLDGLLADDASNTCMCLMLREAMQPSEALDDVVANFAAPHEDLLAGAVRAARPSTTPTEARAAARSILGQVLHLHLFRPFIERIQGRKHRSADVRAAADHVVRFSLRGIGCTDATIERALAARPRTSSRSKTKS